jgi:hypothetical protein
MHENSPDPATNDPDEGDAGYEGPRPSRTAVVAAGAVALVVCAFWLSCHEAGSQEPSKPAQPPRTDTR